MVKNIWNRSKKTKQKKSIDNRNGVFVCFVSFHVSFHDYSHFHAHNVSLFKSIMPQWSFSHCASIDPQSWKNERLKSKRGSLRKKTALSEVKFFFCVYASCAYASRVWKHLSFENFVTYTPYIKILPQNSWNSTIKVEKWSLFS